MEIHVKQSPKIAIGIETKVMGQKVTVDSALSTTSENPVQNKVITAALNSVTQQLGSPSGDPMHYMYEEAGATWKEDTQKWAMDEIDDLTTDEVRLMYSKWVKGLFPFAYNDKDKIRTIFPFVGYSSNGATNIFCNPNIEIIPPATGNNIIAGGIASWFYNCQNLRKIKVVLDRNDFNSANFAYCYKLEEVRIERLQKSVSFKDSPLLSNESILYMIQNAAATGITITLHPTAYARAEANAEIQEAKTNKGISLAMA